MTSVRLRGIGFWIAALACLVAMPLPLSSENVPALTARPLFAALIVIAAALFALAARWPNVSSIAGLLGTILCCGVTIQLLSESDMGGYASYGFWLVVLAAWLAAALSLASLSALSMTGNVMRWIQNLAIPLLFGCFLIYLWEVAVRGFGVSPVLMPAPSSTAKRIAASLPLLGEDFMQTFVRSVLSGYVVGCAAGFVVAIAAYRFDFLKRGLLPLGNFVSALPVVGIAPIMVMWFGFDWQSKAAVVAVMCFFPMLVNTLAGLAEPGAMERDLMRSYAAKPFQTLFKLHLPAAMPFVFNALKINSTLALIGAIVAEFFGTPQQGIGFRISVEVARMSLDMVWAEIALAAVAGMAFYGIVALAERAATSWHPSYRTSLG